MSKHTPGPWTAFDNDDDGIRVIGVTSRKSDVAHCRRGNEYPLDSRRRHEEDFANARLMAAAPDLLAALKAVVAFTGAHGGPYVKARAAIVKAEGKS